MLVYFDISSLYEVALRRGTGFFTFFHLNIELFDNPGCCWMGFFPGNISLDTESADFRHTFDFVSKMCLYP
jgi:hypothetical protein